MVGVCGNDGLIDKAVRGACKDYSNRDPEIVTSNSNFNGVTLISAPESSMYVNIDFVIDKSSVMIDINEGVKY